MEHNLNKCPCEAEHRIIEELQEENRVLREALEWYANPSNHEVVYPDHSQGRFIVLKDLGGNARVALAKTPLSKQHQERIEAMENVIEDLKVWLSTNTKYGDLLAALASLDALEREGE